VLPVHNLQVTKYCRTLTVTIYMHKILEYRDTFLIIEQISMASGTALL